MRHGIPGDVVSPTSSAVNDTSSASDHFFSDPDLGRGKAEFMMGSHGFPNTSEVFLPSHLRRSNAATVCKVWIKRTAECVLLS